MMASVIYQLYYMLVPRESQLTPLFELLERIICLPFIKYVSLYPVFIKDLSTVEGLTSCYKGYHTDTSRSSNSVSNLD